jgi:hypothetical protein
MKKILLMTLVSIVVPSSIALAQCNPESYTSACVPKLTGFNFLKSYKIDGEGGAKEKVEYSYVFTKGTQYMINVCSDGSATDGIVVSLYDASRNKVASSKIDNQFLAGIAYPCNATGIYYIQYTFDKSTKYCGGSALGFKR